MISIGSEESIRVLEKCREIMGCTPDFTAQNNPTSAMFKEDRALFFGNSYASIIADFRDMESDFSVIPTPKWDEEQENYYSCINTWALGGVGVPATCKTPDTVGLIMETLGRVSYMEVRPALYETTIKAKVARDERNAQVLDIIFDNTYIDCNGIFNIGNSANVLGESIMGQSEFASSYAAVRDKIQAGIDDLMKIGK